jgi:cobalt-zinc-cadmium efflux system outer membrane protein
MIRIRRLNLLLPIIWMARTTAAEPPAQLQLSLREALAASTSNNPLLQSGDDRIAAAEAIKLQAGLKPNPRVVIQTENARAWQTPPGINFWHDTDTYLYAGQIIERGGKRERRIDYAAAGVARAESERQLAQSQLRGRVAAAYWTAAAAIRIVDLYLQDLKTFDQIVEFNQSRFREGATAGIDLFRIEIERERLTTTARRAEQEADLARISLLRELGRSDFPSRTLPTRR